MSFVLHFQLSLGWTNIILTFNLKYSKKTNSAFFNVVLSFTKQSYAKMKYYLLLLVQQFQFLLTLFSKSFSPFPHGTCILSVSRKYSALHEVYHALSAPIPRNATPWIRPYAIIYVQTQDFHLLWYIFLKDLAHNNCKVQFKRLQFDKTLSIYSLSSSMFTRSY